jgi:hypothetical protein
MGHRLWQPITTAMTVWHQSKLFLEHWVSIEHDALHLLVGVLLWLGLGLLLRRPLTSWVPWLTILAVIAWNETVDLWVEHWPAPSMQYGEGAKDLLLTMSVPTIMLAMLRFRPELFGGGGGRVRRRR